MSLHFEAKEVEIAETVLLPEDPLRAKWIADTFLDNPICYNKVRGMYGYAGINNSRFVNSNYAPTADFARENNIEIKAGNVLSSDQFYEDNFDTYKKWADFGVLCVEMEAAGIYSVAAKHNVKALTILTISDFLVTKEVTTPKERESTFSSMVEIALGTL